MVDLIEKLSQKQDEIEMRQKYRIASEQQKDGSIIPEKSLQTCKLTFSNRKIPKTTQESKKTYIFFGFSMWYVVGVLSATRS